MTALCNQPEAFASDLGDDQSRYLYSLTLLREDIQIAVLVNVLIMLSMYNDQVLNVTDEWTCPQQAVVTEDGSIIGTGGDLWRCDNMECVHRTHICNDVYDCRDKSDERRCCETLLLLITIFVG